MRYAWLILTLTLVGCATAPPADRSTDTAQVAPEKSAKKPSNPPQNRPELLALLNGEAVRTDAIQPLLIEASGAQVFSEYVLDRRLSESLRQRQLAVTEQDLQSEKALMLAELAEDRDEAARLLNQLRRQRGLGPARFQLLLRRNAGLRKLVQDEVQVSESMVRQAYQRQYGERMRVRMILVPTLGQAQRVLNRLAAGESFIDLAIDMSTDVSRNQGGLLPDISPHDPTFPKAIRDAAASLKEGQISPPVVMDGGFAVLKVERKIKPDAVPFKEAAPALRQQVRLQVERAAMERRARVLIEEADVTVLDARLNETWQDQRREIVQPR